MGCPAPRKPRLALRCRLATRLEHSGSSKSAFRAASAAWHIDHRDGCRRRGNWCRRAQPDRGFLFQAHPLRAALLMRAVYYMVDTSPTSNNSFDTDPAPYRGAGFHLHYIICLARGANHINCRIGVAAECSSRSVPRFHLFRERRNKFGGQPKP